MAKCGTCGSNQELMTSDDLRAWVQPCGPGKDSPKYPAMCVEDGRLAWPALQISNLVKNNRGTPTTIYRKSFSNPCNRVAKRVVRSQPDDNTVDIQMDMICGGVSVAELQETKFDIYLQHVCCCGSGSNFLTSWSGAVSVIRGVDFSGFTIPTLTTTGNDTETELTIQLNGVTFDAYETVTEVDMAEVALSNGLTTGTRISSVTFAQHEGVCGRGSCAQCHETWYALTGDGNVIYSVEGSTPTEVQIPVGAWGTNLPEYAHIAFFNGVLFATYSDVAGATFDGFAFAPVDEYGVPGTWTAVGVGSNVAWRGASVLGSELFLYGRNQALAYIITVDTSGGITTQLNSNQSTEIYNMDSCGTQIVGVGTDGVIYKRDGCATSFSVIPAPAAVALAGTLLPAVSIRVEDEIWVGTVDGQVFCSQDCGRTWEDGPALAAGGVVIAFDWADANTGYIVNRQGGTISEVLSSWDGGDEWSSAAPRVPNQPADFIPYSFDVPCCGNTTLTANNFLVAGANTAGAGVLYKGTSSAC